MILDFDFSLILYRSPQVPAAPLPSCCVVLLPLSLPGKHLAHLPPSSFSPHLSPISDSFRNFPVTSGSVFDAERFGCRFHLGIGFRLSLRPYCRFCFRFFRSLWLAFRRRLCLAFGDRFLHGVRLNLPDLPPDLRCSCLACGWLSSCLACGWLCSCLACGWL